MSLKLRKTNIPRSSSSRPRLLFVVVGFSAAVFLFFWWSGDHSRTKREAVSEGRLATLEKGEVSPEGRLAAALAAGSPSIKSVQTRKIPIRSAEEEEEEVRRCGWKPNESLAGFCPGGPLQPLTSIFSMGNKGTAAECGASCCVSQTCFAWQFREDVGCLQGPDVRLGLEKDGTPEWCEPTAPSPWQGERLEFRHDGKPTTQEKACGSEWNPSSLNGQCFGLGPLRPDPSTPDECRKACCEDAECETWQFRKDKGCFYGNWVGRNCEHGNDFGAFIGRRKLDKKRSYSDNKGRPVPPVTPWPG